MTTPELTKGKRANYEVDLGDGIWRKSALIFGSQWWLVDESENFTPLDESLIKEYRSTDP